MVTNTPIKYTPLETERYNVGLNAERVGKLLQSLNTTDIVNNIENLSFEEINAIIETIKDWDTSDDSLSVKEQLTNIYNSMATKVGLKTLEEIVGNENIGGNTVTELLNSHEGSIVEFENTLDNKVDKTQYASISQAGVIKLHSGSGVNRSGIAVSATDGTAYIVTNDKKGTSRDGSGQISIVAATETEIDVGEDMYKPIVPATLKYAVNRVVGDDIATMKTEIDDSKVKTKEINTTYQIITPSFEGEENTDLYDGLITTDLTNRTLTFNKDFNFLVRATKRGILLTDTIDYPIVIPLGTKIDLTESYVSNYGEGYLKVWIRWYVNDNEIVFDSDLWSTSVDGVSEELDISYVDCAISFPILWVDTDNGDVQANFNSDSFTLADLVLENNAETIYTNKLDTIRVTIPENYSTGFISSIVFESGETAINFIASDTIEFSGSDCINGIFVPLVNTVYDVVIWYNGICFKGIVE